MSDGKTMGERMASVEQWKTDHERRCDERQAALGREIGRLTKGAWSLLIAIAAWALVQVYGYVRTGDVARAAPAPAHAEMR